MYDVGIDSIEIERIKEKYMKNKDNFLKKIYTEKEVEYIFSKNKNMYKTMAGKFAAKEAVYKSLNEYEGLEDLKLKEIEILNTTKGKPYVKINKKNVEKILEKINIKISITHDNTKAVAVVLVKEVE